MCWHIQCNRQRRLALHGETVPMSDDTSDNVKKLPVRFKQPTPNDRALLHEWEVHRREGNNCDHHNGFIVDSKLATVECARCHALLNPMWALEQLCRRDHTFHVNAKRYHEEMQRLAERSRTMCEHCGKMTRISHR